MEVGDDDDVDVNHCRLLLDWGAETVRGQNSSFSVTTRSMSRRLLETTAANMTLRSR